MGLCIGKQGGDKSTSSKHRSSTRSSKVEPIEKQSSIQDAIDRLEKSKESVENELEELKQQLKGTK
jgi:predicted phage-related endonuclease